jgi:glutamate dehydrogenase (NAD(P)+)
MIDSRSSLTDLQKNVCVVYLQGFGNVGSWAARLLHEESGIVKAVGDVTGAVHNDSGLNIPALQAHVATAGAVSGFQGGDPIDPTALLAEKCDVLIPASIEGALTRYRRNHTLRKLVS